MDYGDFHASPLLHQNVILGAPWFHKKYTKLEYPSRCITFVHRNKIIKLQTHEKGNTLLVVNSTSISKLMQSTSFSYLIFVSDINAPFHKESILLHDDHESSL